MPDTPANTHPSKRAFQTQFRRWGFPLKQNPVYRDARLAARVRELWERNLPQREMLRALADEGFEIRDRELVRLRARNGWLLRNPRGDRQEGSPAATTPDEDGAAEGGEGDGASVVAPRKRRRRTRGWAGQPADPPGPPRFPSETTIDEARLILGLDAEGYRAARAAFQRICEEAGLVKKTLAGPERWDAAKAQLVREVPRLQQGAEGGPRGALALDVICTDVTKRMRDGDRRMTLADAKKVLGINPEEARALRAGFYRVLAGQGVQVRCKSTAGAGRWAELMGEWTGDGAVAGLLPGDRGSAEYRERWRALGILATDVMKRMRDERVRKEARVRKGEGAGIVVGAGTSPGGALASPGSALASPGTALASPPTECSADDDRMPSMPDYDHVSPLPLLVPSDPLHVPVPLHPSHSALPTPPQQRLLLETPDLSLSPPQLLIPPETPYASSPYFLQSPLHYAPAPAPAAPMAVYIRLHPSSTYVPAVPLWIATLAGRSLREVREAAAGRMGDAVCVGVEGVLRGEAGECSVGIGGDEELGAYLAHLEGGTPTFCVTLAWR